MRRIDRRDAQHIAHRRVGRRPAPLAQDALAACVAHDVVHGEEVHLVAALGDEVQLLGDLRRHGGRHALRVACAGALPGEPGQRLARRHAGQHRLQRVAVLDGLQAEGAALRHGEGGRQQRRWVQAGQLAARAQALFRMGLQGQAALRHAAAQAHGGDDVLQRLGRARVHVHLARGHQRQAQALARLRQGVQPQGVIARHVQGHGQPAVFRVKMGSSAFQASADSYQIRSIGKRLAARCQQHFAAAQQRPGRLRVHHVAALGRAGAGGGDEFAQAAPALHIARQGHHAHGAPAEFTAGNERQPQALRLGMGTHHPGHRALVGQRQGGVAQRVRALHQLGRVRGAALEAEVAQRVQFGVAGQRHAYTPCRNQPPVPRSRNTHTQPATALWATK